MRAHGQELSRHELARRSGDTAALGGVRHVVLDDGTERGIRAIEFRSGSGLAFDVLVDRAMDIGPAESGGRSFGWRSATGFRHPGLHEYGDENGLSWLRSFSGLTVTGGLDHTLFGGRVDASNYHYPPRPTVWNGLHGRVANIPARLIGAGELWRDDQCILWAEGEVHQAAIFGEHLLLRRRIETDLGGSEIRLMDTVTNLGFDRTPHMFLYHINLGWPLLDAGSRFVAPIRRTLWCTPSVGQQRVSYQLMPPPQTAFIEQVYAHELVADASGDVRAALVNERRGWAVVVEWSAAEFPHLFEWLHLREGAYAVGIEPSTHAVGGDQAARADGSMLWLEHGDSRSYTTRFRVVDGRDAVRTLIQTIESVAVQPTADIPEIAQT
jgi:hypothetical protein